MPPRVRRVAPATTRCLGLTAPQSRPGILHRLQSTRSPSLAHLAPTPRPMARCRAPTASPTLWRRRLLQAATPAPLGSTPCPTSPHVAPARLGPRQTGAPRFAPPAPRGCSRLRAPQSAVCVDLGLTPCLAPRGRATSVRPEQTRARTKRATAPPVRPGRGATVCAVPPPAHWPNPATTSTGTARRRKSRAPLTLFPRGGRCLARRAPRVPHPSPAAAAALNALTDCLSHPVRTRARPACQGPTRSQVPPPASHVRPER